MAFITMLPVILLFTSFVWYSWYAHRAQVAEELAERGRILARALSETSASTTSSRATCPTCA